MQQDRQEIIPLGYKPPANPPRVALRRAAARLAALVTMIGSTILFIALGIKFATPLDRIPYLPSVASAFIAVAVIAGIALGLWVERVIGGPTINS